MSAAGTTARVRREQRRAALGASLHAAVDRIGMSHGEAAALIGVDRSTFDRWADAHDSLSISVADLAALPLEVRRSLVLEHIAPEHDLVERGAAAADLGCDLAHVRALMRDAASAADVGLAAVADGHITPDEGAAMIAASDQVIAAALRLRALGQSAIRERVVAVRRPAARGGRWAMSEPDIRDPGELLEYLVRLAMEAIDRMEAEPLDELGRGDFGISAKGRKRIREHLRERMAQAAQAIVCELDSAGRGER